jgi:hypothetical protein
LAAARCVIGIVIELKGWVGDPSFIGTFPSGRQDGRLPHERSRDRRARPDRWADGRAREKHRQPLPPHLQLFRCQPRPLGDLAKNPQRGATAVRQRGITGKLLVRHVRVVLERPGRLYCVHPRARRTGCEFCGDLGSEARAVCAMSIVTHVGAAKGTTMVPVVVIGAVVCAAVAVWWLVGRGGAKRDADRFAAARTMTNRWAEDPTSAPKPVLDIARQRSESVCTDRTEQDTA